MRNSNKYNTRRFDDREPDYDRIRPGDDDGIELASFAPMGYDYDEEDEDDDFEPVFRDMG